MGHDLVRSAVREFEALDRTVRQRIRDYLRSRIATAADALRFGKALRGDKAGTWAYRSAITGSSA